MVALDYTVIVQIVAFLFLWFLLAKLLFKPFLSLVEERERRTEGVSREADALMEEAERLRREYESGIERARAEGSALRDAVTREAREAHERLVTQAREEARRFTETIRLEIRSMMERERAVAAREAELIARDVAEKILGRRIG